MGAGHLCKSQHNYTWNSVALSHHNLPGARYLKANYTIPVTAGVCARLRVLQLRGGQHPGREHEHRLPRDQPRPPPRPRPLAGGDSDGDPRPEDVVMNM